MDYIIREEIPSVETYRHIRVSAGLSDKTEQAAKTGLRNGLYSVVVCHQDAPVGMGRVIASHGSPGFYARYGFEPALLPERAGMFLRIQG